MPDDQVTAETDLSLPASAAGILQAVVDAAPSGVLAVSLGRRILAFNQRFLDLWGLDRADVTLGGPSPALGEAQRSKIADPEAFDRALVYGHQHPHERQVLTVGLTDGRTIEGHSVPILGPDGAYLGRVWFQEDITERRHREAEGTALLGRLEAAERSHEFLLQAARFLVSVSGYAETLDALAQMAVPTLGDLCLIDVLDDRGEIVRMAARHADPAYQATVARLFAWPPDRGGSHPSVQVMRDGATRWSVEMGDAFLRATSRDGEHFDLLKQLGFTGYMCVPLLAEGDVLGAVTLVSAGSGRRFSSADVTLAEALAGHVAAAVARERRHERQLDLSHVLQSSLLPTDVPPELGLDVAMRFLPGTGGAEVGGDFWDVTMMPSGEAAFAVGDVFGHDMIAAATMAQLRSVCRVLRAQTHGPSELVALLQSSWAYLGYKRLATAVFARVEPSSGRLRVASAGHPPPLVLRPDGACYVDLDPGPPLGVSLQPVTAWEGTLERGSSLIFFTDGLVENRRRRIEEGMTLLAELAWAGRTLAPDDLINHILAGMVDEERNDDIALVVARR